MKTRVWIGLLAGVLAVCVALSFLLLRPTTARVAKVYCDGQLVHTLDLSVDMQITVESQWGTNVITVRGGAVAVTQADCPDGYCMRRGYCSGGPQVVCLPHRVVIRFGDAPQVDAVVG